MVKRYDLFWALFKLCFAMALVLWLVKSGKLDFSLLAESLNHGVFFIAVGIIIVQLTLCAIRWKWLLEISEKFSFFKILQISWIGFFFNSVLPGAVTGDLIKLIYIKKIQNKLSNTYLVMSILIDRILGLTGLITLATIFNLIYYKNLKIIHFNFFLFIMMVIGIIPICFGNKIEKIILKINSRIPILGERLNHLFYEIQKLKKITLIRAFALSIIIQFMNVFAFWILARSFTNLAFEDVFTFIPLGLISTALPISPSGLGVGHIVFDSLFQYVGVMNGASLFNLYFLAMIFVNFLGAIPYLFKIKK